MLIYHNLKMDITNLQWLLCQSVISSRLYHNNENQSAGTLRPIWNLEIYISILAWNVKTLIL